MAIVDKKVEAALDKAVEKIDQAEKAEVDDKPKTAEEKLVQAENEIKAAETEIKEAKKKGEIPSVSESTMSAVLERLTEVRDLLSSGDSEKVALAKVQLKQVTKWLPW